MKTEYPIHIWIEPTTQCNTQCITCAHYFNSFGVDMPEELYVKIRNQALENVQRIDFTGYGEALMTKIFFKMLDDCMGQGILLSTTSNGILLNDKNLEILFKADVEIILSVDGTNEEIYQSIRPKIKFVKILKAL
ncbi:MAG: hypothetical protein HQK84_12420, partial [Nitrospinae bacterium]|nr:hypothetical protein [Nitrospinota bacterium]